MEVSRSARRGDLGSLLTDARIRAVVTDTAEQVAAYARTFAPVETGAFRESIRVEVNDRGGVKGDRVTASVVATTRHGAATEFGNSRTPRGHYALLRALGAVT
ncbi:HK97 gp10 family phage protein [Pseudonocardia alni]|uniref:HK97 gp10 family phage protein n=1 Tax=Pseudonocardia alni TaxID=33907 RepID=UPI0033203332